MYSEAVEQSILASMRNSCRIDPDPAKRSRYYEMGRRYAEEYCRGNLDHHPTTTLRRLLRLTDNAREYLDANYGFHERIREFNNMPVDEWGRPQG